jgi:hypothetical protein
MKMKNKRADQFAAKQKHREQLKAQRRIEPSLDRPIAELTAKPSILIVCEGENTEPSYFNQFRITSAIVKSVGIGYNTISLVKKAVELSQEEKFDKVWCVFDKDDFKEEDFNSAIQIAKDNNFGIAYSNQSFEYWLLLHLNDHQGGAMHRRQYNQKINELLKPFSIIYDGKGSKFISEEFFDLMNGTDSKLGKKRVELAIKRAERNYNQFTHINPAKEESSTTVFKLVRELLEFM